MEKTLKFPEEELVAELTSLQEELGDQFTERIKSEAQEAVWVFRLFYGVSPEKWDSIASKHDFTSWLTLPINGDTFPHLKRLQETIEKLAYQTDHDALTGLANRRAFDRTLEIEIERSRRGKTPVSLALFDLDNFKSINDKYGHPIGDAVLAAFGQKLQETTRRYDLAVRYGGEEFALIMAGSGIVKAQRLLDRLLNEFRAISFFSQDKTDQFSVTCSVGLTCYKGSTDITPAELIQLADDALYTAKSSGKDQVQVSKLDFVDNVPNNTLVQANEKKFLFGGK